MRVFFIGFSVVGLLLLSLWGVREWALMMPNQRFEHPFLEASQKPDQVVRVTSIDEAKQAVALDAAVLFWLDLRSSQDGRLLILPPVQTEKVLSLEALGAEKWKGAALTRYTEEELRVYFPQALRLEDFLTAFPERRMILNLVDNAENVHKRLIELLKPFRPGKNFLFQSDADIVLKSIKDQNPMWLFGSSRSDLMKVLTFESVGLEAASPFRGDVFVSPLKLSGRDAFNQGVLSEMKRRHKDIYLGPLTSSGEVEAAKALSPNGLIYSSVELFKSRR